MILFGGGGGGRGGWDPPTPHPEAFKVKGSGCMV